jgi:hypothetical protein
MRSSLETPFAIFTLSTALIHFTGETYYHVTLGQPLPSYIVDLISIGLMLIGAATSLWNRTGSAAGWLAAAWGFAFCLNYRSFFWRWQELQAEGAISNGEPDAVIKILGVTLTLAAVSFLVAMFLAKPTRSGNA